jgi:predicted GH43/DUF377 family glycosyl hydrolase
MVMKRILVIALLYYCYACKPVEPVEVTASTMDSVYEAIKTPFKYGVVFNHPDTSKMIDSPTIFRWEDHWYMTYIVFDGRGYETWLAESADLLNWTTRGRLLSFTDSGWDAQQKAGYLALLDINWNGSWSPQAYEGKYWMSYLGGSEKGYEAGRLGTGMAYANNPVDTAEWTRLSEPVLAASDADARWYDNGTIFKSSIIADPAQQLGYPFLMFYNAAGDTALYESIAIAGSADMKKWTRVGAEPVITRKTKGSICGDAQLVKMGNLYVMFYFGAFWPDRSGAFERFACSYDLKTWTEWKGNSLVESSEPYDETYAHKPMVINWKGTVYHFYNAVGKQGRVIALATSKPLK